MPTPVEQAISHRQRYLDSFNFAPDGYLVTDIEGNIWEANLAAAALLGTLQAHLPHRSMIGFVAREDQRVFLQNLRQLRDGGLVKGFEVSMRPKEGPPVLVLLEVGAIHDAAGRAVGLRWSLRDIGSQRRIERGLARSNALLTALGHLVMRLETTTDANQVMDTLGTELKQLGLSCFIALRTAGDQALVIRYFSMETRLLGFIEKLVGVKVVGFRLPPERFVLYREIMEQRRPVYVADWVSIIAHLLPGVPEPVIEQAGSLAGMTPAHRVVYLPLRIQERVLGVMGIWGESLESDDVSALAIFAGQVAIALEHGRLFNESETQRAQLRTLSTRLVSLLEDERRRIARELHDESGQLLYGLRLQLDALGCNIPGDHPELSSQVKAIGELVEEARLKIRLLSHQLRPATLDELGLVPALRQLVDEFGREAGLVAVLEVDGQAGRLAPPVETACYRIVQETFTNVLRHADAKHVTVRLRFRRGFVRLVVADDGRGFDPAERQPDGVGLLGIRERAMGLGGEVAVRSSPGKGTSVDVTLPDLPPEE